MNHLGEALGLVRGQGVHRVDHDRLDARPRRPLAVVQHRIEETLRLARAGTGGHQRVGRRPAGDQPPPRLLLVGIGRKLGFEAGEEILLDAAGQERQPHRDIGALEEGLPLLLLLHQAAELALERRRFGFIAGDDEFAQRRGDFAG